MKLDFRFKITVPGLLDRLVQLPIILYYRLRYNAKVKLIHIENFHYAVVDPPDFDWLNKYHWRLCRTKRSRTCYAFRTEPRGKDQTQNVFWMHRMIMNPPDHLLVDHDNHHGLDNRRANLRNVTHFENQQNRRKTISKTTSRYKGVDFVKPTGKWRARILVNGSRLFLGSFDAEIDAAKVYDEAAKLHFKDFACLNFPEAQRRSSA